MGIRIYVKSKSVLFLWNDPFLWNDLFLWELFSILVVCVCVCYKFQKRHYSKVFIESLLSRHTWSFYCVPGSSDLANDSSLPQFPHPSKGRATPPPPQGCCEAQHSIHVTENKDAHGGDRRFYRRGPQEGMGDSPVVPLDVNLSSYSPQCYSWAATARPLGRIHQ